MKEKEYYLCSNLTKVRDILLLFDRIIITDGKMINRNEMDEVRSKLLRWENDISELIELDQY